jgi:hypothetical protein
VEAVLDRVASASAFHFEKPSPDESVGPRRGRGRRRRLDWRRRGRRGAGAGGRQNRRTAQKREHTHGALTKCPPGLSRRNHHVPSSIRRLPNATDYSGAKPGTPCETFRFATGTVPREHTSEPTFYCSLLVAPEGGVPDRPSATTQG